MPGLINNPQQMQTAEQQLKVISPTKMNKIAGTPTTAFGQTLQQQMLHSSTKLPGKSVLQRAVMQSKLTASSPTASVAGSTSSTTSSNSTTSDGGTSQLMSQTQNMMELNNSFNLQYLDLQENMQNQNRAFTSVSNASKSENDTAKNSLSNVRS